VAVVADSGYRSESNFRELEERGIGLHLSPRLCFRRFSLRGMIKVKAEWAIVCSALNLKRMNGKISWSTA
jgi:IS5 family transposase